MRFIVGDIIQYDNYHEVHIVKAIGNWGKTILLRIDMDHYHEHSYNTSFVNSDFELVSKEKEMYYRKMIVFQ